MVWKNDSPYYESSIAPYKSDEKQKKAEKIFCSMCGCALVNGYKYCPKCGKEVTERKWENQCSCGAIFEPNEKFCFSCGKSITKDKKPA